MEAAAKVGESSESTDASSVRHEGEARELTPPSFEIILEDIDEQLLVPKTATSRAHPGVATYDTRLLRLQELAISVQDRHWVSEKPRSGRVLWLAVGISALLMAMGLGWLAKSNVQQYLDRQNELTGAPAIDAVVERIIEVESNGDTNATNNHSSATGLGQFLNDTWLELIRQYRPDLTQGRSESETLELRRQMKLAREITTRFVERNAAILRRRGFRVTAGAIYLAHFAGPAGAVAILSASDNAEAAVVMANADATGKTRREQLIKANPFLERFTVADLKLWAERKMAGSAVKVSK